MEYVFSPLPDPLPPSSDGTAFSARLDVSNPLAFHQTVQEAFFSHPEGELRYHRRPPPRSAFLICNHLSGGVQALHSAPRSRSRPAFSPRPHGLVSFLQILSTTLKSPLFPFLPDPLPLATSTLLTEARTPFSHRSLFSPCIEESPRAAIYSFQCIAPPQNLFPFDELSSSNERIGRVLPFFYARYAPFSMTLPPKPSRPPSSEDGLFFSPPAPLRRFTSYPTLPPLSLFPLLCFLPFSSLARGPESECFSRSQPSWS